jgi:TolB-like protein/DNA-binding winged helix-turn-helix (wHTH) protein/Flp pilus assembly protein TadD
MERTTSEAPVFEFGSFRLDTAGGALLRDGAEVHLRPKSFQVLEYLVRNPGRLVTRRELMDAVWGEAAVTDDSLTQCVIEIRRALAVEGPEAVRTVPRRGFVFELPVTATSGSTAGGGGSGDAPAEPGSSVEITPPPSSSPVLPPPRRTWTVPIIIGLAASLGIVAWGILGRSPLDTAGSPPAASVDAALPNSIAVLRFADLSPAADKQYFADGLAEEVLHRLAQSPELVVIARSSSFAVDPASADIREVAARLNVAHVLEGSVRSDGDELRVTAQLIDARTGAHVWSKRFDRTASDLIALQDEIAASVAESLHATLAARVPGAAPGTDLVAQDLFLQGMFLYNRRGPADLALARDYFERAIAVQPDHARALTALAGALFMLAFEGEMDWEESLATQQALLTRALAANPDLAEAHVRLSNVQYALGDVEGAQATFQRAVELGPESPLVLGRRGGQALREGRVEEAVELFQRVARLDPLSAVSHGNLAYALLSSGRLAEAESAWQRAGDLGLQGNALLNIALVRILQARFGDAVELANQAPDELARDRVLAMAAPVAGTPEQAAAAMQRLESADTRTSNAMLAEVLTFQGHHDEAFAALERAIAASSSDRLSNDWREAAQTIRLSPFLAPLRSDPRWEGYRNLAW